MIIQDFTIVQLCVSPLNVRTNQHDANAIDALAANIESSGLLFPLIVHPSATAPADMWPEGLVGGAHAAPWAALAGGRRYRALRKLIREGRIPEDYKIAAVVRDLQLAEITELSLYENLIRRELNPYEIHAAIARAIDQGATTEEIAEHIGQDLKWVRQQRRLGTLAPEIFQEYAEGRLTYDQARAYGATEDRALQREAFAHFRSALHQRHDAASIRAFLKVGDRELDRLLLFVGPEVYRDAGGRYELDLFADAAEERGRVEDAPLLRELAGTALEEIRANVRRMNACPDLAFLTEAPRRTGMVDHFLQLHPEKGELDDAARAAMTTGRLSALIEIEEDGAFDVTWWWASRQAKADARKPTAATALTVSGPSGTISTPVFSELRDIYGLTENGMHCLAEVRRSLLRALLIRTAVRGDNFGQHFLVFTQPRLLRGNDKPAELGVVAPMRSIFENVSIAARALLEETDSHQVWQGAFEDLSSQPFMAIEDPVEAFGAFVEADAEVRALAGAVLAGLTLQPSVSSGFLAVPLHDRLAELAGGTDHVLREYWQPTPDFFGLFTMGQRQKLGEAALGPKVTATWAKLDDAQLAKAASRAFTGSPRRPIDWVHPLLTFTAAAPIDEVMTAQVEEAAE